MSSSYFTYTLNKGWQFPFYVFAIHTVLVAIFVYILIFCSLYGFFGMLTWLPYYLQTARDIEASQTGIISSLVPWASIPGAILFGFLSDRIRSKKPLIISLALAGSICQFAIPYTDNYSLLIVGLCLYGLLGKLALDPVLISCMADITPKSMYSSLTAGNRICRERLSSF